MSMSKTLLAAALALAATSASAAITYNASGGMFSTEPGQVTLDFDDLMLPSGFASYTGTVIPFPGNGGYAAEPPGDLTAFYSVGATNGQMPVTSATFGGPGISYFGFYMGSPDTYNSMTFYNGATAIFTLNGSQMAAAALLMPDGNQSHGFYMNVHANGGPSFTKIEFSSVDGNGNAINAFETDNHAYVISVPEPESYAMFGAGLGLLALLRRRKN